MNLQKYLCSKKMFRRYIDYDVVEYGYRKTATRYYSKSFKEIYKKR